jgi:type IV secretion system protein VirD4
MVRRAGIPIGFSKETDRQINYFGEGHLITLAPTRSGKGRDILVPALCSYPYSMAVVDPKGELAAITGRYRATLGRVVYLDPFQTLRGLGKKIKTSRYNFFKLLNPKSLEYYAYSQKLASALIWQEGRGENFFVDGASGLCAGIAMGLAEHAEENDRNLVSLRSVLTGAFKGDIDVFDFARAIMAESNNIHVKQMLGQYAQPNTQTRNSLNDVISTAVQQTAFLSDAALAASLNGSDFSFVDLKKEVTTVYIILPINFLDVCGKFFRLLIAGALAELLSGPANVPVLLPMDEFFQLGYLKAIENAMSMAAGYGLQLWPFLQDLSQLSPYGELAQTFIANAGVRMFFAPRDEKTAAFLSAQSGQVYRNKISRSMSSPTHPGGTYTSNLTFSEYLEPVLHPHETKQIGDDEMLVFIEKLTKPARLRRKPYWTIPVIHDRVDPNPYFAERKF